MTCIITFPGSPLHRLHTHPFAVIHGFLSNLLHLLVSSLTPFAPFGMPASSPSYSAEAQSKQLVSKATEHREKTEHTHAKAGAKKDQSGKAEREYKTDDIFWAEQVYDDPGERAEMLERQREIGEIGKAEREQRDEKNREKRENWRIRDAKCDNGQRDVIECYGKNRGEVAACMRAFIYCLEGSGMSRARDVCNQGTKRESLIVWQ